MAGLSQTVLETIAALGGDAKTREIAQAANMECRPVAKVAGTLRLRKMIKTLSTGHYALTDAGRSFLAAKREITSGPCGPHTGRRKAPVGGLRDRLWAALRSEKKASIPTLLQLAVRGDEKSATNNAQRYLKALLDTGFVVVMARPEQGTAPTSNGFKRYFLVRDSGPKAPQIISRRGEVYDRNTQLTYPIGGAP